MLQTERNYSSNGGIINVTGSIFNRIPKMEKGLKIWQAIVGTIVVLISLTGIIVNLATTVNSQRGEIERLKSDNIDNKLMIKDLTQQLNSKYDKMSDKLTEILVALQNKENKK